jgi:DNA-binding Lrp family transcriptional regulator
VARRKGTELSVFKGREAKLNRAIFQALALKGSQTIYEIHKQIRTHRGLKHTKYASVNKRVRSLEKSGYIARIGVRETKAGFKSATYELNDKTYLAILFSSISLEELISLLDENYGDVILASIVSTIGS